MIEDSRGTPKQDYEQRRLQRLTGSYRHLCRDWDGLAIDERDPEFEHCLCVIQGELPWPNLTRPRIS